MLEKGMTIRMATERWVREMNLIPTEMIERLMDNDPDDWCEVTAPRIGDFVYVFGTGDDGEISGYDERADLYTVDIGGGNEIEIDAAGFEVQQRNEEVLPMWGAMWSFGDICDIDWMDEGGIQILSACGFRVYESYDFGYFFGIDGAGYDFYEKHWIPLYKARGLHWHDPETEKEN